MNLRQIKENVFNQSKVTIINLENLINDINESTINEDKALQIWEEAVKDSFIQYGRRLLSGLNSNDFTVYQLESFYKLFKEAVIFNDSTSHNIEQLIIKVRKDLGCRLVTLEEDKTINIKTINHIYIETIELRSEEHTSELQSRPHLVCRLLLEKKKNKNTYKSQ